MDRFWNKVEKTEGCWIWLGALSGGYGSFRLNGRVRLAHHVAHELLIGPLPVNEGSYHKSLMMHRCDNRRCVRPHADHATPATQKQNMQDAGSKGRLGKGDHRGEKNAACRWSDAEIAEMRRLYSDEGFTQEEIAMQFGTNQGVISLIVNFKRRAA